MPAISSHLNEDHDRRVLGRSERVLNAEGKEEGQDSGRQDLLGYAEFLVVEGHFENSCKRESNKLSSGGKRRGRGESEREMVKRRYRKNKNIVVIINITFACMCRDITNNVNFQAYMNSAKISNTI